MGVLNVTPDSFSDGGLYLGADAAVAHAARLVDEGADVLDVGGESSRPGAESVAAAEQIRRTAPVIRRVREFWPGPISIDTTRAEVAAAARAAGADWINDISALRDDPDLVDLVGEWGCPVVLMHMRGTPRTMQADPGYTDIGREVTDFLADRADWAQARGVARERIILDPGIGFGKTWEHNLALLRDLPRLIALGYPVLVGLSRKSFLGRISNTAPEDRLEGSLVGAVRAVQLGARIVRVHDVLATRRALTVARAIGALDAEMHPAEPCVAEQRSQI